MLFAKTYQNWSMLVEACQLVKVGAFFHDTVYMTCFFMFSEQNAV